MSDSRSGLLPLTFAVSMADEENTRVFGAFGGTYFSFYFSYFGFSESLPAGQGVV